MFKQDRIKDITTSIEAEAANLHDKHEDDWGESLLRAVLKFEKRADKLWRRAENEDDDKLIGDVALLFMEWDIFKRENAQ